MLTHQTKIVNTVNIIPAKQKHVDIFTFTTVPEYSLTVWL